jgi:hypothetical protein
MKTIFWLFTDYKQARTAVRDLIEEGFTESSMNAIIDEQSAKDAMDVNWEKAQVQVTDEVGEQTLYGLDRLLARQQPVQLPGVGKVYAGGELATIVVKVASSPRTAQRGLGSALEDLSVTRDKASVYEAGVQEGGLLFWMRTNDVQVPEALGVLQQYGPTEDAGYVV